MTDLPKDFSTADDGSVTRSQAHPKTAPTPHQQASTSLPSFAAFQAHASRFDDPEVEGPEIAPMSSRLACNLCTRLKPMVQEVAIAVAELDESVQSYCSGSVNRVCGVIDFEHLARQTDSHGRHSTSHKIALFEQSNGS